MRAVSRRAALDQLSATDREIVALLSEHRVATTQQISTVLELPERTARYRLDRLWRLGMCGGRQPYADQGSAPYHWWPSRLADAFHRGRELPRGGDREEPQAQFLRHAAAITGLYVALVRLALSLGWELLAFSREVEAREEFTLKERLAAIVPDAFVVVREGEAECHVMVEIDRGTMSIPRLSRKLSLYLAWVASGVWQERHPYVPALLVLTTTPRRVEQVVAKAEERCRAESRTAQTHSGAMAILHMVIAATDCVERPETAVADPVWRKREAPRDCAWPTCSESRGSGGNGRLPSARPRSSRPIVTAKRSFTPRSFGRPSTPCTCGSEGSTRTSSTSSLLPRETGRRLSCCCTRPRP